MICQRCNLPGAVDLDTGGQYHAELVECIARQGERIAELEAERGEAIRVLSVVYEVHNDGNQLSGDEEDDVYRLLLGCGG